MDNWTSSNACDTYPAQPGNFRITFVDNTLVSDNGLSALTGLKKLKRLSLTGALANGQSLSAAIPGLKVEKR